MQSAGDDREPAILVALNADPDDTPLASADQKVPSGSARTASYK